GSFNPEGWLRIAYPERTGITPSGSAPGSAGGCRYAIGPRPARSSSWSGGIGLSRFVQSADGEQSGFRLAAACGPIADAGTFQVDELYLPDHPVYCSSKLLISC